MYLIDNKQQSRNHNQDRQNNASWQEINKREHQYKESQYNTTQLTSEIPK